MEKLRSRLFGPRREDKFFGGLRFRGDHWAGSAANHEGLEVQVLLVGPSDMTDLGRQRHRYESLLQRFADILADARPLFDAYATKHSGERPPHEFFAACTLEHVLLPNPDSSDTRWDITVLGPWPGFRKRPQDECSDSNEAMFVIEMNDWQPVAVELE